MGAVASLLLIVALISGHPSTAVSNTTNTATNVADNAADNATNLVDTNTSGASAASASSTPDSNALYDPAYVNPLEQRSFGVGLLDASTMIANARTAERNSDLVTAAEWWELAAEKGDAEGEAGWGNALARGHGVKMDDDSAFSWFQKSADQGNAWGQWWEADYYEHGYGSTPHDLVKARYWYQKAADQGWSDAKDWLAQNPD